MPRGKAATFQQQRDSILDAAARLFAQRGFAGASMAELAEACGISKALLYHYYRDKEQILFDITNSHVERLIQIAAQVRERSLPNEARFRALIEGFMREYEHAQAYHMVLVQDVKFLGDEQRRTITQKERQIVDELAQVITTLQPRFGATSHRLPLTMIVFGMINWTFTWLRPNGPLTYADMAAVVAEIFLHGVAPPADAKTR